MVYASPLPSEVVQGSGTVIMINPHNAAALVETVAQTIVGQADDFQRVLDELPAAIYVTDQRGTITYFNPSCVELAGRVPEAGVDKWCVTWKLFTLDGEHLPHDQCPMAVAIHERRPVREVEAVAERPDGRKVNFVPFPTPLFDRDGNFAGAVNLLVDVTEQRDPKRLKSQARRCRQLAAETEDADTAVRLTLMADDYDQQAAKFARRREPAIH
jgi:PAS domain S-box-containing protein